MCKKQKKIEKKTKKLLRLDRKLMYLSAAMVLVSNPTQAQCIDQTECVSIPNRLYQYLNNKAYYYDQTAYQLQVLQEQYSKLRAEYVRTEAQLSKLTPESVKKDVDSRGKISDTED